MFFDKIFSDGFMTVPLGRFAGILQFYESLLFSLTES